MIKPYSQVLDVTADGFSDFMKQIWVNPFISAEFNVDQGVLDVFLSDNLLNQLWLHFVQAHTCLICVSDRSVAACALLEVYVAWVCDFARTWCLIRNAIQVTEGRTVLLLEVVCNFRSIFLGNNRYLSFELLRCLLQGRCCGCCGACSKSTIMARLYIRWGTLRDNTLASLGSKFRRRVTV